jgi:acetyl-CoA acyltransferase
MSSSRVAIVAGARTPFVRAGQAFAKLGPLALAAHAVRGLVKRHHVDPAGIEAIAFGTVVPEQGKPNLAREIVFEAGLPALIEAQTVSSYCITGLRTATIIADAIARGRISAGIAGGVEWLSGADPATFREPTTGLTMGEHMEITRKKWEILRTRQDEVALASHRNAVAAADKLAAEIVPLAGVARDSGPRADTSLDKLASLKPAFGADGTITAGNASPVTDGASAVLLMSEERAKREGGTPLAFIEAMDYAALHPDEGLLMAPAITVPRLLARAGLKLEDIDLLEIHGFRCPGARERRSVGARLEGPRDRIGRLEPRQRERQLDRCRSPMVGHRRPHSHHACLRDGAPRCALWARQHLRRRRDGRSVFALA